MLLERSRSVACLASLPVVAGAVAVMDTRAARDTLAAVLAGTPAAMAM